MKKLKYWLAFNCLRILGIIWFVVFALLEMVDIFKFPMKEHSAALVYSFLLSSGLYIGGYLAIEAVKYLRKHKDGLNEQSENPLKKV